MPRADALFVVALLAVTGLALADANLGWSDLHNRLQFQGGDAAPRQGRIVGETRAGGDYRNCEVVDSTLEEAEFEACVLRNTRLVHVQVKESFSEGVEAEDAKFWGGQVFNSTLTRGIVGWTSLVGTDLVNAHARESKLYGGSLRSGSAENTTFRAATIDASEVTGGALAASRVTGSTLRGAVIAEGSVEGTAIFCDARRSCLIEAADLRGAHVENATIRDGSLTDVTLVNCKLEGDVRQTNVQRR